MSQVRSSPEPTAATLVGSLSTFSLLDVLDLLTRTGRTGELQVVGHGLDRRIWVDRGELVETGYGSPGAGLFEMACIEDGWFYFTPAAAAPDGTARASLHTLIDGLHPQVSEWHALVASFPFDAVVRMSTTTPADEVQIRADQWQLLSLVGAGREVREVLASAPLHPLDTLRTLRELANGLLVTVEPSSAGELPGGDRAASGDGDGDAGGDHRPDAGPPEATAAVGETGVGETGVSEAGVSEAGGGRAGGGDHRAEAAGNGSAPDRGATGEAPGTGDATARVGVPVEGGDGTGRLGGTDGDARAGRGGGNDRRPDRPAGRGAEPTGEVPAPAPMLAAAPVESLHGPVMPPPISGDPWSGSLRPAPEQPAGDDRSA